MKIVICGAAGRMGQSLISVITHNPNTELVAAVVKPNSNLLGKKIITSAGEQLDLAFTNTLINAPKCDVVIDFTNPATTLENLAICTKTNTAMVIGTTGFNDNGRQIIKQTAQHIPIVYEANFSIGVNLLLQLVAQATKVLAQNDFDIEVIEAHHRYKTDAPSGTALKIGEVLAQNLQRNLSDCAVFKRYGQTGERTKNSIGFSTIRGGDIVGDHTVLFAGNSERLEITHKASNRETFAYGAVQAALWLIGKNAGLYSMQDVLS